MVDLIKMVDEQDTTTIRITHGFKARLASHGRFGERFEDILIRLLGKNFEQTATGDKQNKTYKAEDIDSKKTKEKRREKNG